MAALRCTRIGLVKLGGRETSTSSRYFSCTAIQKGYDDTAVNLLIDKDTRVIYQGFTGRVATSNAKDSIEYGTNIVGGVTPGKEGEHLGLPLLPDLKKAKDQLQPDATAVFVAAHQCRTAIEDAIEAEIPLIVAVAEHIPLHDILRITSILKTQSKSRLVGANAPGIIAPLGFCRIGFQPLPTFAPGHVGIIAKSGTLSYEAVASITRAGLGQSLCIGMGGDIVAGTNMVDALRVFEKDDNTEAIVVVGEIGGRAEVDAAEWIQDYHRRERSPKPIAAVLGGIQAPSGRIMGHAGAWTAKGEFTATEKLKILRDAGVTMVEHPEDFGQTVKSLLTKAGRPTSLKRQAFLGQNRGYHSMTRKSMTCRKWPAKMEHQRRGLLLTTDRAPQVLEPYLDDIDKVSITQRAAPKGGCYLSITVDRTERSPAIATAPTADVSQIRHRVKLFPYSWSDGPSELLIREAIKHMSLDSSPATSRMQITKLISSLATMYKEKEAVTIALTVSITSDGSIQLHQPDLHLQFDESAYRSMKRQEDIFKLRRKEFEQPEEVEAERHGIVFVRMDDEEAKIGTLVNGAGLAMNTVDALRLYGGKATNFLDTGGKATSETVKKSFELILKDSRVKVIFVNIFGGLTDGGMIADGITLAFKEVDMKNVPVIVRIRGTNEDVGQKKIAESGLGLEAFDTFAEAAKRVVEIANGQK